MKKQLKSILLLSPLVLLSISNALADGELFTVSTKPLSELLISAENSAPANIISLNHSTISAEITGRAMMIEGEAGDTVKKGKRLVTLDCRSYLLAKKQAQAALAVAKTQLNYSNKQYKRNQDLLTKGIIPRETFEKSEAGKLTAQADISLKEASIETTALSIDRCRINAPFSGQVTKRLVQNGQLVTPGTPLFQIMQSDKLEIMTNLSPSQVALLDDSPILEFVSGDKKYETTVRSVIQTIDEATRTQEVRLTLPKGTKVSAGLPGRIEWSGKEKLLPAEFVLRRNNQLGVMLSRDEKEGIANAKFHPLPNAREGQAANISLPESSSIIIKNRFRVKDGQQIKIQK